MEPNIQTQQHVTMKTKKELSMRKLLHMIGFVIFGGLALSILTVPYYIEGLQIKAVEGLQLGEEKMMAKKVKEFLLFIGGAAALYFSLLNIYWTGKKGRMLFFVCLVGLCLVNVVFLFSSIE
ncbi:hypothetical protein [Metabacillus iocasae]|uniref:DUF4064 domain-containing protein n=1 Tax=Priestia iocasae TaxID=2291674 RepID=A0ABS2QW62_9BACI|nr:hypothetical protein [Metabacillus iocasae]MBM7702991.1 hypothetical protein [Metabacillus iocasae]